MRITSDCPILQHFDFATIFINASLKVRGCRPITLYEGVTVMFRLSAYVLAALAVASIAVTSVDVQAGNDDSRRVHKHQTHVKQHSRQTIRMRNINADSRHNGGQRLDDGRKRFNRSTLSTRVADSDHRLDRQRARIRVSTSSVVVINVVGDRGYRIPVNGARNANTYSGDVDIYSVPGVGTYSYGDAIYSSIGPDASTRPRASSLKIIDVGDIKPNNGCDMQAGVCVIRP
jgi:hypothetical protein